MGSLLVSQPAAAQEPPAEAVEFYQSGLKAYVAGEYSEAVLQFQQGYQIDPNPAFLFNIARAYYKLGDHAKALEYSLQARSSTLPDENMEQENTALIPAFRTRLMAERVAENVARVRAEQERAAQEQGRRDPVTIRQTSESGFGAVGWSGVALSVVGAGMLGASLYYNALVSDYDPDDPNSEVDFDDAQTYQSTGRVLLIAGGGVTLVGLGMILYGIGSSSSDATSTLQLAPMGEDVAYVGGAWRW